MNQPKKANSRLNPDFSNATHQALAERGITIIHATAIPASAEDRYFSGKGYAVNDNGTYRIFTHSQVLNLVQN